MTCMKRVQQSDATVYTVALVDPLIRDGSNPRLLRRLARATGGEFYHPRKDPEICRSVPEHREGYSQRLHACLHADEVQPMPCRARRRTVRVYVRSNDGRVLRVRTRDGYFESAGEERR